MKKVLIISVSLRKNSNSDLLAQQFAKGAQEAGYQVETISLREKNIQFCTGCMACLKAPRCVIRDDANTIVEKMGNADVICFATPVYYYEMAGQMKTLLDRANPLFPQTILSATSICLLRLPKRRTAPRWPHQWLEWLDCLF